MKTFTIYTILGILTNANVIYGVTITNSTDMPEIISPGTPVNCTPLSNRPHWCACRSTTSDMVVDLSSLDRTNDANRDPSFYAEGFPEGQTKGWYIAWSPCNDFQIFANEKLRPALGERACKNAGFALFTNGSLRKCISYGSHENSTHFRVDGVDVNSRIILDIVFSHYNEDFKARIKAVVKLICGNDAARNPKLTFVKEDKGNVHATFTSSCCCEGVCAHNSIPTTAGPTTMTITETKSNWGIIGGSIGAVLLVAMIIGIIAKKRPCHGQQQQRQGELPYPVPVDEQEQEERRPLIP